jgi:tetratricopeptide (TPR) repeat protein
MAWAGATTAAQPDPGNQPPEQRGAPRHDASESEKDALVKQSEEAFDKGDYAAAERILRRLIEVDADNFVPWYNLACALCLQGRTKEAGPMLEKAIELGFTDLRQLQTDPNLASLRRTDNYKKLVANWGEILGANIETHLERIKKLYGPRYTYEKDEKLRLAYASAFSAESFAQAKTEIARLAAWWDNCVAPRREAAPQPPDGTPASPAPPPATWVLVVLPTQADYAQWAIPRYGEAWIRIPGTYSHDEKTLRAMDLGSTMRHEFWHVLHWRHMDALGQRHQIWVMEGLCSLVEDVDTGKGDEFRPINSWRTNMAGRLARAGKLTPWEQLFKLDQKKFIGPKPLSYYAQARAVFQFLFEQGKLRDWYGAYIAHFDEDNTGTKAMEVVFRKPVKEIEKDYRAWLRAVPEVAESFRPGSAVFPFDVDNGGGDGVIVTSIISGTKARAGGLRARDVITAINGQPVRELFELVRVLGEMRPGMEVEVAYRRGKTTGTAKVTLVEAE